jgi:hypothetical protein
VYSVNTQAAFFIGLYGCETHETQCRASHSAFPGQSPSEGDLIRFKDTFLEASAVEATQRTASSGR